MQIRIQFLLVMALTSLGMATSVKAEKAEKAEKADKAVKNTPSDFATQAVLSGDTKGMPFAVIDKVNATVSVYQANGKLLAKSPVLVGKAKGDHSVPGIGDRPISQIAEHERTTPAGRFVSEPGTNLSGETVVWIDYAAGVSMHRLRPSSAQERRPERLKSATPSDNRITYGCVNVPENFYMRWIDPILGKAEGLVYVLPEVAPRREVFAFR